MAYVVTSRKNYRGTENHWSDGTVTCNDPDGIPQGCDPVSVAAQQSFSAGVAATGGVLAGVPTFQTVMDNYGEIQQASYAPVNQQMAYYPATPDPRASAPLQVYSRTAPYAGQPVSSYTNVSGFSTDDALGMIGQVGYQACVARFGVAVCTAALAAYTAITGNSSSSSQAGSSLTTGCANGFVKSASGACVPMTNGGGVPAGQVATPADVHAVMGLYGAAVTPFQIGNIGGNPILRCPIRGMVLGRDGLCYNKRDLRKDERKWAPARRPPMTGAEAHTLRTVGTLKKRAKKLAQLAGFAVGARGRSPARPKGRK